MLPYKIKNELPDEPEENGEEGQKEYDNEDTEEDESSEEIGEIQLNNSTLEYNRILGTPILEGADAIGIEEAVKETEKALRKQEKQRDKKRSRKRNLTISGLIAAVIVAYLGGAMLLKNNRTIAISKTLLEVFEPGIMAVSGINPLSENAEREYFEEMGIEDFDLLSKYDPFDVGWIKNKGVENEKDIDKLLSKYTAVQLEEIIRKTDIKDVLELAGLSVSYLKKIALMKLPTASGGVSC